MTMYVPTSCSFVIPHRKNEKKMLVKDQIRMKLSDRGVHSTSRFTLYHTIPTF